MILLCGQKVGVLALHFFKPILAVCYDDITRKTALQLEISQYWKLVPDNLTAKEDLILSVHGREVVKEPFLSKQCFNIHPYLYCYKGTDPVGRAVKNENRHASVGLHRMTEEPDRGEVLFQAFCDVKITTVDDVYEQLYPLYYACFEAFKRVCA